MRDVYLKAAQECDLHGMELLDFISNIQCIPIEEFAGKMKEIDLDGDAEFAKAVICNQNTVIRGFIPISNEKIQ